MVLTQISFKINGQETKQINIPRISKGQKMFLPFEFNNVPAT